MLMQELRLRAARTTCARAQVRGLRCEKSIQYPRDTTAGKGPAASGRGAVARVGTLETGTGAPSVAALHTAPAVALPSIRCPLSDIRHHVRQSGRVGAVGADRARASRVRSVEVAAGLRPGSRPCPLRFAR